MPQVNDNNAGIDEIVKTLQERKQASANKITYILPGTGEQMSVSDDSPVQAAPLLRYYSPRLLGAPPQLTNQCDMRILSGTNNHPGPVGDFYLTKILQDAHIANFTVGRARFTGGMSSLSNFIHELYFYGKALKAYQIYDSNGAPINGANLSAQIQSIANENTYKEAYSNRDNENVVTALGNTIKEKWKSLTQDVSDDSTVQDVDSLNLGGIDGLLNSIGSIFSGGGKAAQFVGAFKTSMSVQRPFYTFEEDWSSYINNVKMMINTAVIMLGLQHACVRIGDNYYPIGMDVNVKAENDVWSNYRAITPTSDLGDVNAKLDNTGSNSQYVSFMVDPSSVQESYSNTISTSVLMSSIMSQGNSMGNEIAFITNSTVGTESDAVIALTKESKDAAEEVLQKLGNGKTGRFTAAIASSMAKSYTGDHTIYPDIFQSHTATSNMSFTIHLVSDSGDPYSYFINILVPMFYLLGMALPALSPNNASAYTYPPLIQCNVPGMWGTRLGMVSSLSFTKNPNGKEVSVNGYPLSVDVSLTVTDLEHVLLTSPMNKLSVVLNNQTMFDYIAQCSGVDKFRPNGSMRTIAKLALTSSAINNAFNNVTDALLNDWHSVVNRVVKYDYQ